MSGQLLATTGAVPQRVRQPGRRARPRGDVRRAPVRDLGPALRRRAAPGRQAAARSRRAPGVGAANPGLGGQGAGSRRSSSMGSSLSAIARDARPSPDAGAARGCSPPPMGRVVQHGAARPDTLLLAMRLRASDGGRNTGSLVRLGGRQVARQGRGPGRTPGARRAHIRGARPGAHQGARPGAHQGLRHGRTSGRRSRLCVAQVRQGRAPRDARSLITDAGVLRRRTGAGHSRHARCAGHSRHSRFARAPPIRPALPARPRLRRPR